MNGSVIRNVVAVIPQRRGEKRHQPYRIHTEFLQVIESLREASEIADAVSIGIDKRTHMHLIDNGVLVPAWFELQ